MLSFKSYKQVVEVDCLWNSDRGQEEECIVVESDLRNVQKDKSHPDKKGLAGSGGTDTPK